MRVGSMPGGRRYSGCQYRRPRRYTATVVSKRLECVAGWRAERRDAREPQPLARAWQGPECNARDGTRGIACLANRCACRTLSVRLLVGDMGFGVVSPVCLQCASGKTYLLTYLHRDSHRPQSTVVTPLVTAQSYSPARVPCHRVSVSGAVDSASTHTQEFLIV